MQSSFELQTSDISLLPKDGEAVLFTARIDACYDQLEKSLDWQQEKIRMFGRWVLQPRLTAWYGDPGTEYTYSGLLNRSKSWIPELLSVKQQVEVLTGAKFNSVLANYYRTGQDSMGWHQDNEPELGKNPVIASVSLGATRRLQFRHKKDRSLKNISVDLAQGNLLLMQGETQNFWQHQLPKSREVEQGRINLTFRLIKN